MQRLKLGFYLFPALFVLSSGLLQAQDIQKTDDTIYVVAKRITDNSQNRVVISRDEIESLPANNVGELLSSVAGVSLDTRNKFGRPAILSLNGSEPRQVKVMIDGIPFNNQLSGTVNVAQFPLENVERIEIVKGPESSSYGSSLGGTVNVITKETGAGSVPQGNIAGIFSEHHMKKEYGEIKGKIAGLGYYLFGSYMDAEGISLRDDVLENRLFLKTSMNVGEKVRWVSSYGLSKGDVNSGILLSGEWERYPYYTRYGQTGFNYAISDSMLFDACFKATNQDIMTHYFFTPEDTVPYLKVANKDIFYGLDMKLVARELRDQDTFTLGLDLGKYEIRSTYLSEEKKVTTGALYTNYTAYFEKWEVIPALRYDYNSEFKDQISPSLGVVYYIQRDNSVFSGTRIKANISRAFNAAPLLWKYYEYNLSFLEMSPDLKPERAMVYQLGAETTIKEKVLARLNVYRADVKDAIGTLQNAAGRFFKQNFEEFRRQGVSLDFDYQVSKAVQVTATSAFNDVENRVTKETVKGQGARIHYGAGIVYKQDNRLKIALIGSYNWWNQSPDYNAEDRTFIWDLKTSTRIYERDNLSCELFVTIYNIGNSYYAIDEYYPHPGRYFEGGAKIFW